MAGVALAVAAASTASPPAEGAGAARFAADIAWLADDARQGRGLGGAGLVAAGEWLEQRLRTLGLAPAGDRGGYRQELEVAAFDNCVRRASPARAAGAPPSIVFNLLARLDPERAPLDDRVIVLGAHYDHLGCGAANAGAPVVYNGADDNASGVAALLETARLLAADRSRLARPVLFALFTAEEAGRQGSNRLVRSPPAGIDRRKMLVMINLDMVGRLRDDRLTVVGQEKSSGWSGEVERACSRARLACRSLGEGSPLSDHISFLLAGVPVLYLTTGTPPQHHRPDDDVALVDAGGGARIAALAADLVHELAARREPLRLQRAVRP
jgi:hypothetical protein